MWLPDVNNANIRIYKFNPEGHEGHKARNLKIFINLRVSNARHRKPFRRGGRVIVLCGDRT
jgi:hypothetical protein